MEKSFSLSLTLSLQKSPDVTKFHKFPIRELCWRWFCQSLTSFCQTLGNWSKRSQDRFIDIVCQTSKSFIRIILQTSYPLFRYAKPYSYKINVTPQNVARVWMSGRSRTKPNLTQLKKGRWFPTTCSSALFWLLRDWWQKIDTPPARHLVNSGFWFGITFVQLLPSSGDGTHSSSTNSNDPGMVWTHIKPDTRRI